MNVLSLRLSKAGTRPVNRTHASGAAADASLRRLTALFASVAAFLGGVAVAGAAAAAVDSALPAYQPERQATGAISSVGDDTMKPLMDAWLAAFQKRQPGVAKGEHWEHTNTDIAFGGLMFEFADIAPMSRDPSATELAPYGHQFAGDMMKSPVMIRVANRGAIGGGKPAYIAVNKRPGSPLPQKVKEFIGFALSRDGQEIVAQQPQFQPLSATEAAQERAKLDGYLAEIDPGIPVYQPAMQVSGKINSVGSDGMKTLMDRWMREFRRQQPGVVKGERWEHLGTLNGFHALIAHEADMAPMGRELWPDEVASYVATQHHPPFEVRVARGGFNTPQRTTAQVIFVHPTNPLSRISVPQLKAILGSNPTITKWGQLGLTGEWADRPITIYMPMKVAPNSMSMQMMVLGGQPWASSVREGTIADTAGAIGRDPGAIGFGGLEEGAPGLKTVPVAAKEGGESIVAEGASTSSGRYPLTRYMYIRLNRKPGEPLAPQAKEFLKYILSRAGQEPVLYSGYFPLNAQEVKEELAKLE